jgi:hypothetical protein
MYLSFHYLFFSLFVLLVGGKRKENENKDESYPNMHDFIVVIRGGFPQH